MGKKTIAVVALIAAAGAGAYELWDKRGNEDLVEARYFAASYERDEASDRCASADLAAMYYRRGGDTAAFQEWKAKADEYCPTGFPYAYLSVRAPGE